MLTVLITWVVLGSGNTLGLEQVSPEACPVLAIEAVKNPTVKAAICVHRTGDVIEALTAGSCKPLDANNVGGPYVAYMCNGHMPKWS